MVGYKLVCCAVFMSFSMSGVAATQAAAPKAVAKAATTSKAPASPKPPAPKRLRGKKETLACRLGTEDRHARIAVVLIGGTTDSFAYYSKWKPRTCSIYLQRSGDMYSKWADSGAITTVNLERGAFLIEHKKSEYHFIFRDIDRERYCGMDGVINGSLTIRKGSDQCQLDGEIMVEGTPLGQAFVNREEDKPPPGLMPDSVPASAAQPESASAPKAEPAVEAAAKPAAQTSQSNGAAADKAPTAAVEAAAKPAASTPQSNGAAAGNGPAAAAPAPPQSEPVASGKPSSDAPQNVAQPAAKPAPEKPAEAPSSNPVRAFFRSLTQSKTPDAPAKSE
jgi:hypothetical protein